MATKHGMSNSREYRSWSAMLERCGSPKCDSYENYGGRGITVCERWRSFENFYADMGPRPSAKHSIDRINNDGHYEPSNCRWATRAEQNNNMRTCRPLEWRGRIVPREQLAAEYGLDRRCLDKRLKKGMSLEEALTAPLYKTRLGGAKLTAAQAEEIRRSPLSSSEAATAYGVTASHIRALRRGHHFTSSSPIACEEEGADVVRALLRAIRASQEQSNGMGMIDETVWARAKAFVDAARPRDGSAALRAQDEG